MYEWTLAQIRRCSSSLCSDLLQRLLSETGPGKITECIPFSQWGIYLGEERHPSCFGNCFLEGLIWTLLCLEGTLLCLEGRCETSQCLCGTEQLRSIVACLLWRCRRSKERGGRQKWALAQSPKRPIAQWAPLQRAGQTYTCASEQLIAVTICCAITAEAKSEEDAAVEAAVAARLSAVHRPPPWMDVTIALRFMVEDSRVILHKV